MTNRGETSGHTQRLRSGDLGTLMRTGHHRTMEYVQARLEQLGFDDIRPAHMAIFQNLGPEGARIGELAERAKLTNQSVGYLVDYLEEHGYVERRPDPTNRRATLVCFTERGWDEADACAKILDQLDKELTERMGAERLEQLRALLAEAAAALQASKLAVRRPLRLSPHAAKRLTLNASQGWLMCLVVGEPSATLMIMSDNDRLAKYEASTREPLDLLALATLWLVVVPPPDFGHNVSGIVWTFRIALSVVYGIDIAIRSALAPRHVHYALAHPLALVSVVLPPLRVIFSLRLVRSMFRRGSLPRFLVAATVLVLNGAAIVYLFERHAPHSNIRTLGESLWWSFVTVTTVGYGDYYPVTIWGRITACFIMATGLLTLAVVTAQVASSFVAQGQSRAAPAPDAEAPPAEAPPDEVTLAELDRRLARIERLLTEGR